MAYSPTSKSDFLRDPGCAELGREGGGGEGEGGREGGRERGGGEGGGLGGGGGISHRMAKIPQKLVAGLSY